MARPAAALAVDRLAHRIDDTAKPAIARPHGGRSGADDGAAAASHAFQRAEWHQQCIVAGETDHLTGDRPSLPGLDRDLGADRHRMDRAGDLDHQTAYTDDAAIHFDAVEFRDLLGQSLHEFLSGCSGINPVFTRVVNHCDTVRATAAGNAPETNFDGGLRELAQTGS